MAHTNYTLLNECDYDFTSNEYYVYLLVNPLTNVPFYVGKGRADRAWRHITLRRNKKLHKSNPHKVNTINKIIDDHNHKITIRLVFACTDETEAFDVEQFLISVYGRVSDGSGCLANITEGGDGYTSGGIPVHQYTMWGEFVQSYKNAKEAARLNGWKTYSVICACCKGRERSYKGFLWSYENKKPNVLTTARPVYQWTLTGELVNVYKNASVAARELGCDPSTITDCIRGYTRQAVGYTWSNEKIAPRIRPNAKLRPVIHLNTNTKYSSVSEAAKATAHSVGDVSGCCNGRKSDIGGDKFCYVVEDQ